MPSVRLIKHEIAPNCGSSKGGVEDPSRFAQRFGILVDGDDDRLDVLVAPAFTRVARRPQFTLASDHHLNPSMSVLHPRVSAAINRKTPIAAKCCGNSQSERAFISLTNEATAFLRSPRSR
jgi:hypothetical protein